MTLRNNNFGPSLTMSLGSTFLINAAFNKQADPHQIIERLLPHYPDSTGDPISFPAFSGLTEKLFDDGVFQSNLVHTFKSLVKSTTLTDEDIVRNCCQMFKWARFLYDNALGQSGIAANPPHTPCLSICIILMIAYISFPDIRKNLLLFVYCLTALNELTTTNFEYHPGLSFDTACYLLKEFDETVTFSFEQ